MNKHLSGHMYYRSVHESDSGCGNCDGANCDCCEERYTVDGINDIFSSIDKAKEEEEREKSLLNEEYYNPIYFVMDDKLYATVNSNELYIDIQCNEKSPKYETKLKEVKQRHDQYDECSCINKDDYDGSDCSKHGCCDEQCYFEMKNKIRIEKKWYM